MAGSRNCGLRRPRGKMWTYTQLYENSDWRRREGSDMHIFNLINMYAQGSAKLYAARKMDIGKSVKAAS